MRTSRRDRIAVLLLAALIAAGISLQLRAFDRALHDDAYISFIYARNLAEGHGLVYNPGEPPVEGYTNFLWTLLCSAGILAGAHPAHTAQILGMLAAAAVLILCWRLTVRMGSPPLLATLAAALLLSKTPFLIETVGGLETVFFSMLILGALMLRIPEGAPPRTKAAGSLLLAAAALTRPEGILFFALFEIHDLAERLRGRRHRGDPRPRDLGWRLAPFAAVVGSHLAWRALTYGDLLPNSFYAKATGRPDLQVEGLRYLWHGIEDFLPLLFLLPYALLPLRGRERCWRLCLFVSSAYGGYLVLIGGDSMPGMRFIVPILPVWCALAVDSLRFLADRLPRAQPALRAALAAALILVLGGWSASRHHARSGGFLQREAWNVKWEMIGRHLDRVLDEDARIAVSPAGIIPYTSRRRAIDMLGLNDAHIARTEAKGRYDVSIGHEKGDGEYVLRQAPDVILFVRLMGTRHRLPGDDGWVRAAQRLAWGASESEIAAHASFGREYVPREVRLPDGSWLTTFVREPSGPSGG